MLLGVKAQIHQIRLRLPPEGFVAHAPLLVYWLESGRLKREARLEARLQPLQGSQRRVAVNHGLVLEAVNQSLRRLFACAPERLLGRKLHARRLSFVALKCGVRKAARESQRGES